MQCTTYVMCVGWLQEVKHLRDQLKQAQLATVVEVQCEMASRAYDLIMGKSLCKSLCSTLHHSLGSFCLGRGKITELGDDDRAVE